MAKTPAGYEVGPARLEEIENLPSIESAAASLFPPDDLDPELREAVHLVEFFEDAFAEERLWVARTIAAREPVGFAVTEILDASAHLVEMDVLPEHGRQGLGRVLVECAISWAHSLGSASLTLTTFRHIPWNGPFYARLGFVEMSDAEIGPELRAALAEETEEGLDPSKRIAMRLEIASARTHR